MLAETDFEMKYPAHIRFPQACTLLRHAPPKHTPTATAPLPSWDEVPICTSKAWDEMSYNRLFSVRQHIYSGLGLYAIDARLSVLSICSSVCPTHG